MFKIGTIGDFTLLEQTIAPFNLYFRNKTLGKMYLSDMTSKQ